MSSNAVSEGAGRTALVVGVNGQDGSYLAERLAHNHWRVVGTARQDQPRAEVCSLRPDVDVRLAGVDAADTLLLPAGNYVFAWRGADGAVHFHRFAAVAGRELTVRPMY